VLLVAKYIVNIRRVDVFVVSGKGQAQQLIILSVTRKPLLNYLKIAGPQPCARFENPPTLFKPRPPGATIPLFRCPANRRRSIFMKQCVYFDRPNILRLICSVKGRVWQGLLTAIVTAKFSSEIQLGVRPVIRGYRRGHVPVGAYLMTRLLPSRRSRTFRDIVSVAP
jgi:hypothetical protein